MDTMAKTRPASAFMRPVIKLLHVEDSRSDAVMIKGMLSMAKNHHFELCTVASVSAAIEKISHAQYDIILLDLGVEDSFGINTLERVHDVAPNIPIVITTGDDSVALIQSALRHGAQDYLLKGKIGSELLNRTIHNAIDRKSAESKFYEKSLILDTVMEAAQLTYWDWHMEENIEYVGMGVHNLLGYSQSELEGRSNALHSIVYEEDLPGLMNAFKEHVSSKSKPPIDIKLRVKHKNGSLIKVLYRGKVIEWSASNTARRLVSCFISVNE